MENALRIGNDANFEWSVKRIVPDQEHPGQTTKVPYDLTGRNLRLWLVGRVDKIEVTDFTVNANVISWTFFGKDQQHTGVYNALLCENLGEERMVTVDIQYAATLVAHSWQEAGSTGGCGCVNMETIQLESTVAMEPGPRGYSAYEIAVQNGFEGTEQEWLASLALTFDELTPEQKAELKGEDGDTVVYAVVGTNLSISGPNVRVDGTNLILV